MEILGFNFSGDKKSNNAEFLQNFWEGFDLSRIFEGKVTKLFFLAAFLSMLPTFLFRFLMSQTKIEKLCSFIDFHSSHKIERLKTQETVKEELLN